MSRLYTVRPGGKWYQRPMTLAGGAGLATAGYGVYQGDPRKVAAGLAGAAVGGMSPAQLRLLATGAAPQLGRTAAAVAGPAYRAFTEEPETAGPAPADIEQPEMRTPSAPEEPSRPPPTKLAGPIDAVAGLVGIPARLLRAHIQIESGGNLNAVGDQGRSIGVMQIQPGTFAVVAPDASRLLGRRARIDNPLDNLLAGGLLLRRYLDKTNGDWHAAAQMYNGGEATTGNAHTHWYADQIAKNFLGSE